MVQIADQVESFLVAVTEVAKGDEPGLAVPFLLLEVSQLLLAGGRLGAHEDIVPDERYEPDPGFEPDADELRENLARLLEPVDVYSEVFDPYEPRKAPVPARISDDLADVIADLRHGMVHYRAGRTTEALWWWQFSYFSNWGSTASATLRALHSVLAHIRLDQPLEELNGLDTDQSPWATRPSSSRRAGSWRRRSGPRCAWVRHRSSPRSPPYGSDFMTRPGTSGRAARTVSRTRSISTSRRSRHSTSSGTDRSDSSAIRRKSLSGYCRPKRLPRDP